MANDSPYRLRFGPYEVDLHTGELWMQGTRLKLAGQPFEILAVLLKRSGQLVTREELRTQLWPDETFVDFNHGLNAAVNKLRDVLGDSADNPRYIETLPRRGYRFIAPVGVPPTTNGQPEIQSQPVKTEVPLGGTDLAEWAGTTEGGEEPVAGVAADRPGETTRRARARWSWWSYAVLAVVLILGLWLGMSGLRSRSVKSEYAAPIAATIRLSPLTALSDRTSQPAFSPDGSRVAFVRKGFLPKNSGIWSKQVEGEELIQLTNDAGDCCPVWSPDGHFVAFSRLSEGQRRIEEVSARGGAVRELAVTDLFPEHGELDWSPDGKTLAYVATGIQGSPAIFLLSLENRALRQLTMPLPLEQDWGPAFSPDGGRIAFARKREILVMSLESKEIQRLAKDPVRVMGSPAWTADGRSLVFASISGDEPSLMRIPVSGGVATPVREAGSWAWDPAISKRGFRLACNVLTVARSIDQIDLYSRVRNLRTLVTTTSGQNGGAQVSPDGRMLAFQSDRGGGTDIWISDRDGQNPVRLTAFGTATAPRWSPDGREIAFEVHAGHDGIETQAIFLVNLSGGVAQPLLEDQFNNRVPRWSRDGKWIYFATNRSGEWQIWKLPEWGGSPVQVTHQGGFAGEESFDGRYLYYAKDSHESPEIWRMPAAGGAETQVNPMIRPLDWAAWAVVEHGILFSEPDTSGNPTVSFYDFSIAGVHQLGTLDQRPFWMTVTPDGKSLVFDQAEQLDSRVMLLEGFR